MRDKWLNNIVAVLLFMFQALLFLSTSYAGDSPRMSKDDLREIIGSSKVVILDVRTGWDWSISDSKIKGAIREEPGKFAIWADKYPKNKTVVLYCA